MAITQISIFLMNQPGQLVDAVSTISETGSNIRAMSIAEANDFGILRAIVSDTDKVCDMLKEKYLITRTPVLAARMDDRSGALRPILAALNESNINIDRPPRTGHRYGGAGAERRRNRHPVRRDLAAVRTFRRCPGCVRRVLFACFFAVFRKQQARKPLDLLLLVSFRPLQTIVSVFPLCYDTRA